MNKYAERMGERVMKKWFYFFFFISIGLILFAGCSQGEASNGTGGAEEDGKKVLKMATSADFKPFEFFDEEGNFAGFDIDLAHLIAEELGYELEIEDMNFDGLIGALQANRVDMVMAGMSATEERKKNVDFSIEYHRSGEMFIVQKDSGIDSLDDLQGKIVGVQLGTIQEEGADLLSEEYGFEVKKLDTANVLIQELITGRIDVGYLDKEVALGIIAEHDITGFDDPTTSTPGMAIAFPKGSELKEKVDEVLQKFQEDGTLQELKEKWKLTEE